MPKRNNQRKPKNVKKNNPRINGSKFGKSGNGSNSTNISAIKKKSTFRETLFKKIKSTYDSKQNEYVEAKTNFFKQNKKTEFNSLVNLENANLQERDSKKQMHWDFIQKGKIELVSANAEVFDQTGAEKKNFQQFCEFLKAKGYEPDGVSLEKDSCVKSMFNLLTIDNDGGYSDFVRQAKLFPGNKENAQLAYKSMLIKACLRIADTNLYKVNGNDVFKASREFLEKTEELLRNRHEAKFKYDCAHDLRIIRKREIDANNQEVVKELKQEHSKREASLKKGEMARLEDLPKTDVFLSDFVDLIIAVNDSKIYFNVVSVKEVMDNYLKLTTDTQKMNYFLELTARYPFAWEYNQGVLKQIPEKIQACGNSAEVRKYYFENRRNMDGGVRAYLLRRIHALEVVKVYNDLNENKRIPKREAGDVANGGKLYQTDKNGDVSIVAPLPGPQSSENGCWSCSIQMMLRCHGIEVSQEAIRAFRPDYPENERKDVAEEYSLDESKSILDYTDSALAFAPDKMVRSFKIFRPEEAQNYAGTEKNIREDEYIKKATEVAAKKIRKILNEDKCSIAFSDGSHYYSILDIKGDWLKCYDSKTGKTTDVHLRTVITEVFYGRKNGYPGDIHFAWLSDIELAENGKDFLNVPSHYLQMKEDGSFITPPKEVMEDAEVNKCKYQKMGMHVRLLGGKDNTAYDRLTESPLENGLLLAEQAYLPQKLNAESLKRKMQERSAEKTEALKKSGKELLGENFQKKEYSPDKQEERRKAVEDNESLLLNVSTIVNFKEANGLFEIPKNEEKELWSKPGAIVAFRLQKSFSAFKQLCNYMVENGDSEDIKGQWLINLTGVQELYDKLMAKLEMPENAIEADLNKPEQYTLKGYFKNDADIAAGLTLLTNINGRIELEKEFGTSRAKYKNNDMVTYNSTILSRFAENIKEVTCNENNGNLMKLYCRDKTFAQCLDRILVLPCKDAEILNVNWLNAQNDNIFNYVFDSIITCKKVIDTNDESEKLTEWKDFHFDAPNAAVNREHNEPQVQGEKPVNEQHQEPNPEDNQNQELKSENNQNQENQQEQHANEAGHEQSLNTNETVTTNVVTNAATNVNANVNTNANENANANANSTTNVVTNEAQNVNANAAANVNTNIKLNDMEAFEAQMARRRRMMELETQRYRESENDRLSTLENVGKKGDSPAKLHQKQLKAFLSEVSRDITGASAVLAYEDLQKLQNSLSGFLAPKNRKMMSYNQLQEYYNRYERILTQIEKNSKQFGQNKKVYDEFLGIMGKALHEMSVELKKAESWTVEERKVPVIDFAKVLERSKSVTISMEEKEHRFENGKNGQELVLEEVSVKEIEQNGVFVPHEKPFDAGYELNKLYRSVAGNSEIKTGFTAYLLNSNGGDLSEVKKLQQKHDPKCDVKNIHLTFSSPDAYRVRFDTLISQDVDRYAAKMNYIKDSKEYEQLVEVAQNYTKDVLSVDKLIEDMGKVLDIQAKKADRETLGIQAHDRGDMRASAVSMLAGVLGVESALCKSQNMEVKIGEKTYKGTFTEDKKGILYDESSVDRPELADITPESLEGSPELMKSLANLQIMDYLTGKTGRGRDNLSIIVGDVKESDGTMKKKVIGVQGIHNENCFGANLNGLNDEMVDGVKLEDCRIIPKDTADRISNLSIEAFGAMLMGYGLSKGEVSVATGRLNTLKKAIASARKDAAEKKHGPIKIVSEEEMKKLSFRDDLVGMPGNNQSNYFSKLYQQFSSVTSVIDVMLDEIKNTSVSAYYRMGDADLKIKEALSKPEKMGKGSEAEMPAEYTEMEKATRELNQLESRTDRVLFKKATSKNETYYEPNRGFDALYAKSQEAAQKADAWVRKLQETLTGMKKESPDFEKKNKELENAIAHRDNILQLQESYNTLHLMPARFDKYLEIYRKRGEQMKRENALLADRTKDTELNKEARFYAGNIAAVGGPTKPQPSVDIMDQKKRFIAEVDTFKHCYDGMLLELKQAKMRLMTDGRKKGGNYTLDGTNDYKNMADTLDKCIKLLSDYGRGDSPKKLIEKLDQLGKYAEIYYQEHRGWFDRPVRGYGRVRLELALDLSTKAVAMARVLGRCRNRIGAIDLLHSDSSLNELIGHVNYLQDRYSIDMKGVPRKTYASEKKIAELQFKALYKLSKIKPDVYRLYSNSDRGIDKCTSLISERKYAVAVPVRAELYEYYHSVNKIFKKGIKPEEAEEIYDGLSADKVEKRAEELAHNPLFEDIQRIMHRIDNSAGLEIWEKIDFAADDLATSIKSELNAMGPSKEQLIDSVCKAGVVQQKGIRQGAAKKMALDKVTNAAAEVLVKKALLSPKGRTILEYMAVDGRDTMYRDMVNCAKEYFKKNKTLQLSDTDFIRKKLSNAFDKKIENKILKYYMDTRKPYPDVKAHINRVLAQRNAEMKAGEKKNAQADTQTIPTNNWKK